jgi:uncharacterized membrane protein
VVTHASWNDWNFGWGCIVSVGSILLIFWSFGNWDYTYRKHERYAGQSGCRAMNILDERYVSGEIDEQQYSVLKTDLVSSAELQGHRATATRAI